MATVTAQDTQAGEGRQQASRRPCGLHTSEEGIGAGGTQASVRAGAISSDTARPLAPAPHFSDGGAAAARKGGGSPGDLPRVGGLVVTANHSGSATARR